MTSGKYAKNLRQSFPKIYLKVFLTDGLGMNSKLILNQIQPLSTSPSTSSARSSYRKPKCRSIQCSSMASFDPLNPHGVPRYYLYQRKTAASSFCVDHHWLNTMMIRNQYPLPLPEENDGPSLGFLGV